MAETEADARLSYPEIAYREIKRRIQENELPGGFQATEKQVAEMLEMSRTPVREALLRLETDGLVELTPRHGMRVLHVSPEDMREIYEILSVLEARAAESVAAKGLPDSEIAELEQIIADMDAALEADDLDAWVIADERFHDTLVRSCGNQRLQTVVNTFLGQTRRVRKLTLRLRPKPTESNIAHAAVVDAIKRRDPRAAWRVHRRHREKAGTMLVEIFDTIGLNQF